MAKNFSPVLVQNAVAYAQAQAGSFAHFFGSEERIENAIRVRDAVAVVAEGDLYKTGGARAHDLNARGTSRFSHRVVGIIQNVEKPLLQLMRVADHMRQIVIELLDDLDSVALEVVCAQLNRAAQDSI